MEFSRSFPHPHSQGVWKPLSLENFFLEFELLHPRRLSAILSPEVAEAGRYSSRPPPAQLSRRKPCTCFLPRFVELRFPPSSSRVTPVFCRDRAGFTSFFLGPCGREPLFGCLRPLPVSFQFTKEKSCPFNSSSPLSAWTPIPFRGAPSYRATDFLPVWRFTGTVFFCDAFLAPPRLWCRGYAHSPQPDSRWTDSGLSFFLSFLRR